jgi:hypothetical protein
LRVCLVSPPPSYQARSEVTYEIVRRKPQGLAFDCNAIRYHVFIVLPPSVALGNIPFGALTQRPDHFQHLINKCAEFLSHQPMHQDRRGWRGRPSEQQFILRRHASFADAVEVSSESSGPCNRAKCRLRRGAGGRSSGIRTSRRSAQSDRAISIAQKGLSCLGRCYLH